MWVVMVGGQPRVSCVEILKHTQVPMARLLATHSAGRSPENHDQEEERTFLNHKLMRFCMFLIRNVLSKGFPGSTSGKEQTCQFRRHKRRGFDPWVTESQTQLKRFSIHAHTLSKSPDYNYVSLETKSLE